MLVFLLPNCQIINKFTGIIMFSIETDYYRKMQKALIINDNEKKDQCFSVNFISE